MWTFDGITGSVFLYIKGEVDPLFELSVNCFNGDIFLNTFGKATPKSEVIDCLAEVVATAEFDCPNSRHNHMPNIGADGKVSHITGNIYFGWTREGTGFGQCCLFEQHGQATVSNEMLSRSAITEMFTFMVEGAKDAKD